MKHFDLAFEINSERRALCHAIDQGLAAAGKDQAAKVQTALEQAGTWIVYAIGAGADPETVKKALNNITDLAEQNRQLMEARINTKH